MIFLANYFGAECPACGKTFHENDDIVVCPICGAPHHRACYQQSGKCTFDHLHAQGYMWEPPQPQQQDPETDFQKDNEGKICPTCGTEVAPGTILCWKCGTPLGENNMSHKMAAAYYTMAFGGVSPEEDILGVSARDLALYVGQGSHYFLPRFRDLAAGKPFAINLPALLNFFYFFYRKMYVIGAALLGLYAITLIPSFVIASEMVSYLAAHFNEFISTMDLASVMSNFQPQKNLWAVSLLPYMRYIITAVSICLSLFGNRMYLYSAVHHIKKIHLRCEQSPEGFNDHVYTEMLARRGHTSFGMVIIVFVGIVAAYFLISFLLMLPNMDAFYYALGQ